LISNKLRLLYPLNVLFQNGQLGALIVVIFVSNMKNTEKYKLPLLIKTIILTAFLIVLAVISVYIIQFGDFGNFGNQEKFGLFGDYIGGLTNPILTFLTVVLLIWSVQIQVKELNATREELEETRKVHSQQFSLNKEESIRKQLHDDSNLYIKNCEELMDKPIFQVTPVRGIEARIISVNDTFKNSLYYDEPIVGNLINDFPSLLEKNEGAFSLHLHKIRTQLIFSVSSVCNLIQYLELEVLRKSWDSRVRTLITECESVNIITKEEAEEFNTSLLGANVIKQDGSR